MNMLCDTKRGSSIMILLILVFIACFTMLSVVAYVYSLQRLDERGLAVERASATAEAGLHQVIHYFVKPSDIPSNVANRSLISDYMSNGNMAPIRNSGVVFVDASSNLNTNLISLNNATVTKLEVTAPRTNATSGTYFSFHSTAVANTRGSKPVTKEAFMDVMFTAEANFTAPPAAIISGVSVGGNGQFNMHWGEAWCKGDITLLGNATTVVGSWSMKADSNQVKSEDAYSAYRSVRNINGKGGPIKDSTQPGYDPSWNALGLKASGSSYNSYTRSGESILFQNQGQALSDQIDAQINKFGTLGDSQTGYEYWKNVAKTRGQGALYFRPSADGSALYNAAGQRYYINNGQINTTGAGSELSADGALSYYRTLTNPFILFFDTTNGNPPASDGSNLFNLTSTGAISGHSSGILYFTGSLTVGGSGNPPSQTIKDPAGNPSSQNTYHDGIIFTYKDFIYQGNPVIWGSVICKGAFDCGGTPNIFYKSANNYNNYAPLDSRAKTLAVLIQ
ncbi:MAG: hypothetical protein NTX50_17805 [Candidatus Sumerlaeota bacterium]|nr:hypothetical protein [Candidatus Sumerlaeota bacterium]